MTEQEISHGLSLLVDDNPPLVVDVDTVIAKARLRTKRRNALIGTALGAAAIITAAVALTPLRHAPPAAPGQLSWPLCSEMRRTEKCVRADGVVAGGTEPIFDERSARLTAALAAASPGIMPAGMTFTPRGSWPNYEPAPPLTFFYVPSPIDSEEGEYRAAAQANTDTTHGALEIAVLGHEENDIRQDCMQDPEIVCLDERRTDGSHVIGMQFIYNIRGHVIVRRPDGTMVRVSYQADPALTPEAMQKGPTPFPFTLLTKIADIPALRF